MPTTYLCQYCFSSVTARTVGDDSARLAGREPAAGAIGNRHQRQHDGHFDQDPDDCRQRRPRIKSEQADGDRDRQFEKIGCADQGAGRSNVERDAQYPGARIGDNENSIGLDQQRHGDQRY